MKKKIITFGIILGTTPIVLLLLTKGLNVLFKIGTWIHWSFLILYGVAMIFLGIQYLIAINGNVENLLKTEFGEITFKIKESPEELRKRHEKSSKQFLGIAAISIGVITLLLTSTLF